MESSEAQATHAEWFAAQQLQELIQQGKAEDVLSTYSFCKQSCDYVYGIVRELAYDEEYGLEEPSVQNFCKNLLDDWSK